MRSIVLIAAAAAALAGCMPDDPPGPLGQPGVQRLNSASDWQAAARVTAQEIRTTFGDRMRSISVRSPETGPAFDVGYADLLVTELVRAGYAARIMAPQERAGVADYEITFHSETVRHPTRSSRREVLVTTVVSQRGYDVSRRSDVFVIADADTPTYHAPRGRYVPVQTR
ncbi:hypothetical protein FZ983_27345 [Azospirillum sp. B21]|uniref:hypothetical protein n=1 Tax=Azospirillum sp. B21 TaxID=2607496 RepID=UPI0011F03724|nr:hypothetical protein [Azospirillum sp. B21]KAA0574618.1 hypothetical protein FZ983_27345 [Azospirillum sp. B21]